MSKDTTEIKKKKKKKKIHIESDSVETPQVTSFDSWSIPSIPLTVVNRLFPVAELEFEGTTYEVKPIPLGKLPMLGQIVTKLINQKASGKADIEIIMDCLGDLKILVAECVDVDLDEVPLAIGADICMIIMRQNFSNEILGKWKSLGEGVIGQFQQSQE
jgi:hypothetical protein